MEAIQELRQRLKSQCSSSSQLPVSADDIPSPARKCSSRHPNITMLLKDPSRLSDPYCYVFQGKWTDVIRRRKLVVEDTVWITNVTQLRFGPVANRALRPLSRAHNHQSPSSDLSVTLYSVDGTPAQLECIRDSSDAVALCRIITTSREAHLLSDKEQTLDATECLFQHWTSCHVPLSTILVHGMRAKSLQPVNVDADHDESSDSHYVLPANREQSNLTDPGSNSTASTSDSCRTSYSPFTGSDIGSVAQLMRDRSERNRCSIVHAWSRWDNHYGMNFSKRATFINLLDELCPFLNISVMALHSAASYLDTFLAKVDSKIFQPTRTAMQVVLVCCLLIAAKNHDETPPTLSQIGQVIHEWTGKHPAPALLTEWELRILDVHAYQMQTVSLLDCVHLVLSHLCEDALEPTEFKDVALLLADGALCDAQIMSLPVFVAATAIVATAASVTEASPSRRFESLSQVSRQSANSRSPPNLAPSHWPLDRPVSRDASPSTLTMNTASCNWLSSPMRVGSASDRQSSPSPEASVAVAPVCASSPLRALTGQDLDLLCSLGGVARQDLDTASRLVSELHLNISKIAPSATRRHQAKPR